MASVETMNDYAISGGGRGGYGSGIWDIIALGLVTGGGFLGGGRKDECGIGCRDLHQTQDAIIDEIRDDFNTLNITMNQANYANQAQFSALNSKIDQTKFDLSSKMDAGFTAVLGAIKDSEYRALQNKSCEQAAEISYLKSERLHYHSSK